MTTYIWQNGEPTRAAIAKTKPGDILEIKWKEVSKE